jgi:hypothetical protein
MEHNYAGSGRSTSQVIGRLAGLRLARSSSWQVLLAIVSAAGPDASAELSIGEIAGITGLSPRTVKGALAGLVRAAVVVRLTRYRRLRVPLLLTAGLGRRGFTARQTAAVKRAMDQVSALRMADARGWVMPGADCVAVGLAPGTTYGEAFESLVDPALCRKFVGIVLTLRHSDGVVLGDLL